MHNAYMEEHSLRVFRSQKTDKLYRYTTICHLHERPLGVVVSRLLWVIWLQMCTNARGHEFDPRSGPASNFFPYLFFGSEL